MTNINLSDPYEVPCVYQLYRDKAWHQMTGNETVRVSVPGSKSITNRALLLATLAQGTSTLHGVLFSDDSRHFISCIQELGFTATVDEEWHTVTVTGHGGAVPKKEAGIYVGSAGTAARFLTAFLGVSEGVYHIDASEQMRRRPMAPLLSSLRALGCEVLPYDAAQTTSPADIRFLPCTLRSHGFKQQQITIRIDHSSQFLSALLIASCLPSETFSIQVEGSHGMAYIDMTCRMMEQFGVTVDQSAPKCYRTPAGQHYQAGDYQIEPDVSAACYFYAWAPLLHVPVQVAHVHFDSLQGDVAFLRILEQMGCTATDTPEGILLLPPAGDSFPGVCTDMSACSDQAITLAAIAPFASSPTTITGIGHIRFQESDRIRGIVTELSKMGIQCDETEDSVTIYPGTPTASLVETYEDHRMAMGFSLIGLRTPGIRIADPGCCGKTFEDYFTVLEKTIQSLENVLK